MIEQITGTYEERISAFQKFLRNAKNIVFFGGAGVSTASGLPDFRSANGLYNKIDPKYARFQPEYLLSSTCLNKNPDLFFSFLREKMNLSGYEPNAAHRALAKMEQDYHMLGVITQNIDGFHQKAGSKNVAEIHGTMAKAHCGCRDWDPSSWIKTEHIPHCPHCAEIIRPAVTLYGEALPIEEVDKAAEWIEKADLLIIGGTSLRVEPAASLALGYHGENIIIINKQPTVLDEWCDIIFRESIERVLSDVVEMS